MAKQKPAEDGTTIIKDPIPDSEIHQDITKSFDFDFSDMGVDKATEETEEDKTARELKEKEDAEVVETEEIKVVKKDDKPAASDDKVVETEELTGLRTKATQYESRIQELETQLATRSNAVAAVEEFQKEPLAFMRKYVPELANTLNPDKYILGKLRGEFGAEFSYDPSEGYAEGTKSYQWRLRYDEMKDYLFREEQKHSLEVGEQKRKQEALFTDAKKEVMTKYKLDDVKFKELQTWAEKTVVTPKEWALLRYHDQIVKKAVDNALAVSKGRKIANDGLPEQSVAGVHGDDEPSVPAHIKELNDVFGDIQ